MLNKVRGHVEGPHTLSKKLLPFSGIKVTGILSDLFLPIPVNLASLTCSVFHFQTKNLICAHFSFLFLPVCSNTFN